MKLTVPDAARRVGRSPETVRRWIWSGRLPSEKVGNQHLVDADALDLLAGATEPAQGSLARVGGEWGSWLSRADRLREDLRTSRRRLPAAADLLAESRRGR
jgi:excisionase family DNA binding protein